MVYSQAEGNGKSQPTTTGAVAQILEDTYAVMGTFFELKSAKIAGFLADSLAHALEDRIGGRRGGNSPTFEAEQKIEAEFRTFLDANEMNKISLVSMGVSISGAADRGVSHRKKHPFAGKNPSRPAFIDTGLYRASFRAVVKL